MGCTAAGCIAAAAAEAGGAEPYTEAAEAALATGSGACGCEKKNESMGACPVEPPPALAAAAPAPAPAPAPALIVIPLLLPPIPTVSSNTPIFFCSVSHMLSSQLLLANRYKIRTSLFWPMRCTLSSACKISPGDHDSSANKATLARVKFMPVPQVVVLKTATLVMSSIWNCSMSLDRPFMAVAPSIRMWRTPSCLRHLQMASMTT